MGIIYMYCAFMAVFATLLVLPAINGLGTTLLDGDVYVEVFAAMSSDLNANGTCSGVESESVQNVAAIKWTFSELNKRDFIPGVRIGVRVSETCRSAQKAKEMAYALADEMKNNGSDIIGLLGSDYSSDTDAISRLLSSLPDQQRLLQIGYASTSAFLRDRNIYGNFFRVIPPDNIQVEAMIEMIIRLNWTYMALIYDDDSYGNGGKESLLAGVKSRDICFPVQIPVNTSRYDVAQLQAEIQSRILNAEPPIEGILVFGISFLADTVLRATENVLTQQPNATHPVFLFSEASGSIEGHSTNISKGAFVVSPPRRTVDEFHSEWVQLFESIENVYNETITTNNKWLRILYSETFGCELAQDVLNNTCPSITEHDLEKKLPSSVYNQYAIQAALVMAKVIQKVHDLKCGSIRGFCSQMRFASRHTLIDIMKDIRVNFDQDFKSLRITAFQNPSDLILTFNGEVEASIPSDFPVYAVYNHQVCDRQTKAMCLKEVAELQTSGLTVSISSIKDYDKTGAEHTWPDIRKPQCPDHYLCSLCLHAAVTDESTLFIPGDLYVVGVVPVHNIGPTPLKCDGIKQGGLDIVESIRFAVGEAKTIYKDKVPSGSIGVILIDSCNDPQIVQERMLTLHRLGVYQNGAYIPVGDKIIGYVGGWSSDVSKAVGAITTRLGFPQISYGSTAPVLSRKSLYPYFLRVPSPDGEQARVMLNIVKDLNANFIQIVYSETAYGEGGRDILLYLIQDMEICVAQTIGITAATNPAAFIQSLRQYNDAHIVIMFAASFEIEALVPSFTTQNLNKNEFLFISSEGWGTRIPVTGLESLKGSITLASELQLNDKFIDHMKALKPDRSNINPWIRPYMEKYFQCYYEWSYNKTSGKKCNGTESLDVRQQGYRIDAWSKFAEKAVLALLQGSRSAMDQYCAESSKICGNLHNNTKGFLDILKQTRLNDDSGLLNRIFDDNGDGLAGYKIYTIALSSDGDYKRIGSGEPGGFTFHKQQFEDVRGGIVTSTCGSQEVCQRCFPVPAVAAEADAPVGFIVLAVILAIICCVLAGILLFICNRHGCCLAIENGRPRFTDTYLTPVYLSKGQSPPRLPKRPGDENYDSIQDSNGSHASFSRQPPGFSRDELSHRGIQASDVGSGSQQSESNATGGSGGSYLVQNNDRYQSGGSKTSGSASGSGTKNLQTGDRKVVYQEDGSYITTSSMSGNNREEAIQGNSKGITEMTEPVEASDINISDKPPAFHGTPRSSNDGGYLKMNSQNDQQISL